MQNQEIIYTHRTRDGQKARIVARVNHPVYPMVVAILNSELGHENMKVYTENLTEFSYDSSMYDLVEYSPWSDVKVDTPILVRNDSSGVWHKRHFAKYEDGKVFTWYAGCTSWSNCNLQPTVWDFAKLPETEE